jgi:hypothetical protein
VVFNYPGMGYSLLPGRAEATTYPVLLGFTSCSPSATVVGSLVADIGYAPARPEGEVLMSDLQAIRDRRPTSGARRCCRRQAPRHVSRGWEVFAGEQARARRPRLASIFILLFCFVGPHFYHTNQVNTEPAIDTLCPPGQHPLGTDENGYDELGRLMVGGQISLEVGLAAAVIASVFGTLYGAISGYFGGFIDALMMRIVDAGCSAIPMVICSSLIFHADRDRAHPGHRFTSGSASPGWSAARRSLQPRVRAGVG